ncbi:unnamed protein product, partial [Prorocentrum cordatum]
MDAAAAGERTALAKGAEEAAKVERLAWQSRSERQEALLKAREKVKQAEAAFAEASSHLEVAQSAHTVAKEKKDRFDEDAFKKQKMEALRAFLEQALHPKMPVKYLVNYILWEMMTFGSSPTAP